MRSSQALVETTRSRFIPQLFTVNCIPFSLLSMHYFPAFSLTLSFNESKRFSGNGHLKKTSRVKWIEENRCFSNNYLSWFAYLTFYPCIFQVRTCVPCTPVTTPCVSSLSSKTCALKYKKTWLLKKRTFLKLRHPSQQSRHKKFTRKWDSFQTHQKSCREIETQAKVFWSPSFSRYNLPPPHKVHVWEAFETGLDDHRCIKRE